MTEQLTRADLREYQDHAIEFTKDTPYCALWIGMRLGKTVVALTAVSDLYDDFAVSQVLVVAPLRVALASWPRDFHKWSHLEHLTYSVIRGTPKQRENLVGTYAQVHIINRENLAWLVEFHGENWPYDCVILDEARSFKNHKRRTPKGKLTRFGAMFTVRKYVDRVIELTGTPAPGGLIDLWAQVYLLDLGERLGHTITAYRDRWFSHNKYIYKWLIRKGASRTIYKRVSDIAFVLESGDYVTLPEKLPNYVDVKLPAKLKKTYDYLEKEFLLVFEEDTLVVPNAAAKLNKMLQVSNGAVYIDNEKNWKEVHKEKLFALDELIEAANGEPVLIAYTHIPDKERILARYSEARFLDADPKTIDRWNNKEIPILVCHPASAGHGLDLYGGGNTIIWFGMTYDLEMYDQLNERLSHPDKTEPIIVHHLLCEGTADRAVVSALGDKAKDQQSLITAVKNHIAKNVERQT